MQAILGIEEGIIGHQVNCQLVVPKGSLFEKLAQKYPHLEKEYKEVLGVLKPVKRLGKCQVVEVIPKRLFIANLVGQYHFKPKGVLHTEYGALAIALNSLRRWRDLSSAEDSPLPIYLPYKMGCEEAGGNWAITKGIIRDAIPDAIITK